MENINQNPYIHTFHEDFIQKTAKKTKIPLGVINKIFNYYLLHQNEWNDLLQNTSENSLLLRHNDTKLPFTVEYWKTGELLIHTKKRVGAGGSKKIMISIDLCNQRFLARAKGEKEAILQEGLLTDLLAGRGIVEKYKNSYYLGKHGSENAHKSKYAMILDLYDGTVDQLNKLHLPPEDVQNASLDLAIGLADVHERGFLHNDYKPKNIFYKIDPYTHRVKVVLGDFGSTLAKSKMNNSGEDNQKAENQEVERMIDIILMIHNINKVPVPPFLEEVLLVNSLFNNRNSNKMIYSSLIKSLEKEKLPVPSHDQAISAKQVVTLLKEYYKLM